MKVQLLLRKDRSLIPTTKHDDDLLKSLHPGDRVICEIKKSRNPDFHRKAFAMLHEIFDNQDTFTDFDRFREWLQIAAGIVETIIGPDGQTYYKVKSLAFHKMDNIEFERTYQALITAACEKLGMVWVIERYA